MDATLQKLIEDSGPMWCGRADRKVSPVLLRTPDSADATLYELSLPEGEDHPFWRVRERQMAWDEREGYAKALAMGRIHPMGFAFDDEYKVAGHVYNGRNPEWLDSIPRDKA